MKRRFFLFAAPAIVAAPSLMRVSTLPTMLAEFDVDAFLGPSNFSEIITQTLRNRSHLLVESVMKNNAVLQRMFKDDWKFEVIYGTKSLTS